MAFVNVSKQYRGFRIPSGTTIFINVWGISHDPDVHERPEDFWPDRWMLHKAGNQPRVDDTDLRNYAWFGSGRRFCPGIHLANNSLVSRLWYVMNGN
jgi:cytochrome P450